MESKVNYTVVGAFVIALTAAIVVATIWLSAGFSHVEYEIYAVYMDESVTGLNIDSPVKYNGVDVGLVKNIELSRQNPQRVRLLLNVKADTPITIGTTATLNVQGLTGVAYVSLQGTFKDNQPLQAKPGESYPVIKSSPSLLVRLDTTIRDLSRNLDQISTKAQAFLNTNNQHAVEQTLANLNQLSSAFINQTLPAANQALNNLNTASLNLASTIEEIKENPTILLRGQTPQPAGPGEK